MKYLFLILLASSCCCVFSQELFIDWSVPQPRTSAVIKLLPDKGLDFFAYKFSGRNIIQTPRVTRYENGTPLTTKRIDQKIGNNMVVLDELVMFGGGLTGFFRDRRDGTNSLYMIRYDKDGEPFGETRMLSSFPFSKRGEGKGSFNLITSRNNAFLCVEYIIPAKRDQYDRYGYTVIDSALNVVSEGEYEIPYRQNDVRVDMRFLSDRGDYILGMSVYNDVNLVSGDYSSIEKTVVVQVHNDTLSEYELLIEDKRVFDIGMNSRDGILTVTGTYGKAFATGAEGAIIQKIDLDKRELKGSYLTLFPREFLTRDMTRSQLDRLEKNEAAGGTGPQLTNYYIREVHNESDGSTIVVAEEYYVFQQASTDMRGISQAVYQYFFKDVIAYKLDSAGIFSWVIGIPKEQHSINDDGYYSSEVSFIKDGKLNILFNDNRRNYDELGNYVDFLRTATFPARKNAYAFARVAVDLQTGSMTRSVLNEYDQTNGLVVMQLTNVNHARREILLFSSGKRESFGLLRY